MSLAHLAHLWGVAWRATVLISVLVICLTLGAWHVFSAGVEVGARAGFQQGLNYCPK